MKMLLLLLLQQLEEKRSPPWRSGKATCEAWRSVKSFPSSYTCSMGWKAYLVLPSLWIKGWVEISLTRQRLKTYSPLSTRRVHFWILVHINIAIQEVVLIQSKTNGQSSLLLSILKGSDSPKMPFQSDQPHKGPQIHLSVGKSILDSGEYSACQVHALQ